MNQLSKLSDLELENSLTKFVRHEREILHIILEHIREVARRELHLARGFGDLKSYLIGKYGYSERAAYRRIDGARLLSQVPTLVEKIKDGSMDITKISEITRAVKEKERATQEKVSAEVKADLVDRIAGKNSFESQKEIAQVLNIEIKTTESKKVQKDESVRLEVTLTKEQYEQLLKCRDLAAHKLQQDHLGFSMASLISVMADQYLRVKGRGEQKQIKAESHPERHNRTLTLKTKKEVFQRDQCCQYKDPITGKVCGSTFALQADHLKPQWAGGRTQKRKPADPLRESQSLQIPARSTAAIGIEENVKPIEKLSCARCAGERPSHGRR